MSESCESLWVRMKHKCGVIVMGVVYRPPKSNMNAFFEVFEDALTNIHLNSKYVICVGDFNIDILNSESPITNQFSSLLESLELKQVVNEPTRICKDSVTLIDLVIVNENLEVSNCNVYDASTVTDHCVVACNVHLPVGRGARVPGVFRDFAALDLDHFYNDLAGIPFHSIYYMNDINDKINCFNNYLSVLMDKHVPLKTIRRSVSRPVSPWLTDTLRFMIDLRNKALKKFRRNKSPGDWEYYKQLRNYVTHAVKVEKRTYYGYRLSNLNNNEVWRYIKSNFSLNNKQFNSNISVDVDEINKYFANICTAQSVPDREVVTFYKNNFKSDFTVKFSFVCVSEDDILKALNTIKSKAIGLDGIPITLLHLAYPYILPTLTHIINYCLENSVFPNSWKGGLVRPIPKVNNAIELKDFRPITILPAISKILERVVESQLRRHITDNNILPTVQSGFRPGYSCGTALAHVTDDIMDALDKKR